MAQFLGSRSLKEGVSTSLTVNLADIYEIPKSWKRLEVVPVSVSGEKMDVTISATIVKDDK
jgi:hypothetical protein